MSWGFTKVVKHVQKSGRDNSNVNTVKGKRKRKSANTAKSVGLNSRFIGKTDQNSSIRKFVSARRLTLNKL